MTPRMWIDKMDARIAQQKYREKNREGYNTNETCMQKNTKTNKLLKTSFSKEGDETNPQTIVKKRSSNLNAKYSLFNPKWKV
jgi:hypothetical protein